MALIKCSECGKEISSKASACPYCGCPIEETVKEGIVRIKMPNNIVEGWVGLFSSRDAIVKTIMESYFGKASMARTPNLWLKNQLTL